MALHLHQCTLAHLKKLVWISDKTFRDAFEAHNNPVDFERYMAQAFNENSLGSQLSHAHSFFYFVYDDDKLAGYFKLNEMEAQTDLKEKDNMELERIYVLNEFQGRKIGEWILKEVQRMAQEKNKAYLWLGVWEQNTAAISFYERHGFIKFGRHPYFIGEDKQMDWLMRLDLITLGDQKKHAV